ncbi:hypothetical protein MMC19_003354 [Ptychographa xylographoides]|nr:hypothetical protein [Ptychographa xylographoides]
MATLAFVNPSSAYIFGGTFCALPVRPFWYRLALSWIPRYIIISMVITIYLAVYLYVRHKFKDINQDAKGGTTYPTLNDNSADLRPNDINGTKIPTKERSSDAHHNSRTLPRWLSPTPPESVAKSGEDSINESGPSPSHQTQATWENYSFGGSCPISNIPPQDCIDSLQQTANTTPPVDHHSSTASTAFERRGSRPSLATINSRTSYDFSQAIRDSRVTSYAPTFTNSSTSATTNHALFPAKPSQTTAANFVGVLSPVQLSNIEEDEPNATRTLSQSHKSIKRKLRLLFIYPLFYMLMWIVPFASHCLQYSDYYSMNPPYLLSTFSIVFLGLQGAVDSLLFSQREKPWRHASNHSFCRITRSKSKQRRDRSNRKTGKESVSMPMASVETNTVTTPKGSMLGTSKNRPALRKSLVRKSVGRDKDWWDVEGRMRSDSVMLATDHNCADHDRIVRLHSGDQEDTIEEEHTGEARHEDNIDSTGAKSA